MVHWSLCIEAIVSTLYDIRSKFEQLCIRARGSVWSD
jgi:hypothetical protein